MVKSGNHGPKEDDQLPQEHSIFLRFLGAVDGNVVPSGAVVMIRDKVRNQFHRILIDAGSAIREETREGRFMEALHFPGNINTVVITHSHTDHSGDLPRAAKKNPGANIYCPHENIDAVGVIVREAYKRRKDRDALRAIDDWRKNATLLLKKLFALEKQLSLGVHRGKGGQRKNKTTSHDVRKEVIGDIEHELDTTESMLWRELGLQKYSMSDLAELLDDPRIKKPGYEVTYQDLEKAIEQRGGRKMVELGYQGILTPSDVEEALKRLTELPFHTRHKIGSVLKRKGKEESISLRLNPSGHTQIIESAQAFFEIPAGGGKRVNILFSGDRGNSQFKPPYAQANDNGLEDKADVLILEATYGDRVHGNREEALQKLDRLVYDAIQKGEDIIFPIISLDRPMMVMFEIVTRLFKNDPSLADKVDIRHFGNMIKRFLIIANKRKHPMEKEIQKFWNGLVVDAKQSQLKILSKKGKKSRFFFAGGGFVPKEGSPAGAIMNHALKQEDITILGTNYYGDYGSNGYNLYNNRPFVTTKEEPIPRRLTEGQKADFIPGFSGHEDGPNLVAYARKVMRKGGTIYLNHGTEKARQALYYLLMNDPIISDKQIKVILPTANRDYIIKPCKKNGNK